MSNTELVTKIAQTHEMLLNLHDNLTKQEKLEVAFSLVGLLMAQTQGQVKKPAEESQTSVSKQADETKLDNPGTGKVLAYPGDIRSCLECSRQVYKVVSKVRGQGMGINALLQAYEPIGEAPKLRREHWDIVTDEENNVFIDCPLCKGDKTLQMIGVQVSRKKLDDDNKEKSGGVGSISGEGL